MNEYVLVFVAALLLFNLPRIFGHLIKGLGLKKIELTFAENEVTEVTLPQTKGAKMIQYRSDRKRLNKKGVSKLRS